MSPQRLTPLPKRPDFGTDPKLLEAEQELGVILAQFMGGPVTENMIRAIEDTIEEFRVHKLLSGVKMIKMRVVALPQSGFIQIWPAEMEHKDIQLRISNLIKALQRQERPFEPEELAKAVRRAYPDYSPSMSLKVH